MSNYKLIEGEFTVAEAKELVGSLFEYKIQFHSRQNFSHEIRRGLSDSRSLERKHELQQSRQAFLEHLSGLDDAQVISVTAQIVVI